MNTHTPCDCAPSTPQLSFNYSQTTGQRVGGACGGVYWIPAKDFSRVVQQARTDPRVLNGYRFQPLCGRGQGRP